MLAGWFRGRSAAAAPATWNRELATLRAAALERRRQRSTVLRGAALLSAGRVKSPPWGLSNGALMDVAPTRSRAGPQRAGDGMVGLFIVGLGVLIRGIIGAGHPAAGEAEPQFDPVVSAGQAFIAAGRVWQDGVGNSDMAAWTSFDVVCLVAACSCHQGLWSGRAGGKGDQWGVNRARRTGETGNTSQADHLR
jgi:hypothetical protein